MRPTNLTHLHQLVNQQVLRQVIEDTVRRHQDHVAVFDGKIVRARRVGTVGEHVRSVPGRRQRQLERGVEVVLLLLGAADHATPPHHHVAAVADVGRVQAAVLAVEDHHARRAATWRTSEMALRVCFSNYVPTTDLQNLYKTFTT